MSYLLLLLLIYGTQAFLINPTAAYYRASTRISLGLFIAPSELPAVSVTMTDPLNPSPPTLLSFTRIASGELIFEAPPGRNGSQLLQVDLSGLGRGLHSALLTYYDDPVMTLAPDSPSLYRSTGGNNLRLIPASCQQLCSPGSTITVLLAANESSLFRVSMQATLSVVSSGSFVYEGIIPYGIKQLENVNGSLTVLVSYNGQHFQDSTARITLKKTEPLRVGFALLSTVLDFGWSYSCNQARMAISERYGRSMTVMTFSDLKNDVPTLVDIIKASRFDLWIYCSGVRYDANREVAKLFPQTAVVTTSGDDDIWQALGRVDAELTDNFGTCWGSLEQARYLAGITAGGFALRQGLNRIGYVASLRIQQVILGLNAFALGARSVHPNISIEVSFTGAFYDPYSERFCAERYIADGIRILAQHSDSKEPQLAAQRAGGWAIGSNSNIERALFGDFVLTTPFMIWANTLMPYVERVFNDKNVGFSNFCGLEKNCVGLARFSPLVSDAVQSKVREAQDRIIQSKSETIFCGEIKDSKGIVRVPFGQCISRIDRAQVTWLLDNVRDLGDFAPPLPYEEKGYLATSLFAIICTLMVLLLLVVLSLMVFVVWNRDTPVMRAASWKFLIVILFGVTLSLCAVPMLGVNETRTSNEKLTQICVALPWLVMFSMLLSFGSLFAKTGRLFYLFTQKSKTLHRTQIKDSTLAAVIIGTALPGIIVCVVWTELYPVVWDRDVSVEDEFGHPLRSHGHCHSSLVPPLILAGYFILILLVGNYLAFATRNLPTSFTESKWIAQVLSSVFQCLVLYIPLDLLIDTGSTEALFLLRSLSLLLVNGMLVCLLFVPKLMLMSKYNIKQLEDMQSKSMSDYLSANAEGSKP